MNISELREKLVIDMIVSGMLNLPSTLNKAIADGLDIDYLKNFKKQQNQQLIENIEKEVEE